MPKENNRTKLAAKKFEELFNEYYVVKARRRPNAGRANCQYQGLTRKGNLNKMLIEDKFEVGSASRVVRPLPTVNFLCKRPNRKIFEIPWSIKGLFDLRMSNNFPSGPLHKYEW